MVHRLGGLAVPRRPGGDPRLPRLRGSHCDSSRASRPAGRAYEITYRHRLRDLPRPVSRTRPAPAAASGPSRWTGRRCRGARCPWRTTGSSTRSAWSWLRDRRRRRSCDMTDDRQATDDDLDRLPTDEDLGRLQLDHGPVLPARDQPGQRAGPRQDRPQRPVQHRRRRHGPGDDPGRRRARRAHPQVRREDRRRSGSASSSTARRAPSRTPPGTRASSTTSSTSTPAAASGSASCPRSTRRSCSRACSPAPPTSTATRPTRPRSAAWPTRSTAGPTGTGPERRRRRSPTAGGRRPASSRTAGSRRGRG